MKKKSYLGRLAESQLAYVWAFSSQGTGAAFNRFCKFHRLHVPRGSVRRRLNMLEIESYLERSETIRLARQEEVPET